MKYVKLNILIIISIVLSIVKKWFGNEINKRKAKSESKFLVESIGCSHTGAKCPYWSLVGKNSDNIIGRSIPFKRSQKSKFFPSPFFDFAKSFSKNYRKLKMKDP
jgi:hypothetical protein